MNKIKKLIVEHPVMAVAIVILLATLLTEIHLEHWLSNYMDAQNASYLVGIVEQGAVGLLVLVLLHKLGWLHAAGFTRPSQWKAVWLIWPILLYAALNGGTSPFDGTLTIDTGKPLLILLFVLLYLSVGFMEEVVFRSATLTILLNKWGKTRKQIYAVVLLSNLAFGALHLVNLVMGRRTLLSTGAQIVYGTFFGVFFAACYLRNRSVWPVILGHALFDLCGNFSDIAVGSQTFDQVMDLSWQNALITTLITLPLLIYGLVILRKVETDPVPALR
ncbi:MAG: protease family protein [Chloroflexota bacterium]|nr:protease family protein [Chloroflexota bacterium]